MALSIALTERLFLLLHFNSTALSIALIWQLLIFLWLDCGRLFLLRWFDSSWFDVHFGKWIFYDMWLCLMISITAACTFWVIFIFYLFIQIGWSYLLLFKQKVKISSLWSFWKEYKIQRWNYFPQIPHRTMSFPTSVLETTPLLIYTSNGSKLTTKEVGHMNKKLPPRKKKHGILLLVTLRRSARGRMLMDTNIITTKIFLDGSDLAMISCAMIFWHGAYGGGPNLLLLLQD